MEPPFIREVLVKTLIALLEVSLLAGISHLGAQQNLGEIGIGTRVRVEAPQDAARKIVGRIVSLDSQSIIVLTRDMTEVVVPLAGLEEIEWSQGRDLQAGLLGGAMVGAGVGALALVVAGEMQSSPEGDFGPVGTLFEAAAGAVLGGLVGGMVGLAFAPERWEWMNLRQRIVVVPWDGYGIGFAATVSGP